MIRLERVLVAIFGEPISPGSGVGNQDVESIQQLEQLPCRFPRALNGGQVEVVEVNRPRRFATYQPSFGCSYAPKRLFTIARSHVDGTPFSGEIDGCLEADACCATGEDDLARNGRRDDETRGQTR